MFMNSSQNINGSVQQTTHVSDNIQTNTLTWTIPNFINILNNKNIMDIRAPKATSDPPAESKFHLMLQFHGVEHNLVEIYYLSTTPELLKSISLYQTAVVNQLNAFGLSHPQQNGLITTKECQFVQALKWQYLTHLFKLDDGDTSLKKIRLNSNGSFCLKFEFVITVKNEGVASFLALATQTNETQLTKDLQNLFNEGMFSDVVMKSADDEEFKVHKVMLASRSPVLKAHFEHNFTESVTNVVESPIEAIALREVLSFIYTDKAKVDEIPEKLLAAADYYQLSRLKTLSEDALHEKLSIDNAIEILQLADLHSANTLKQQTLEYIKYGPLKSITKTEGWKNLQSVELIKLICDYCN